MISIGANSEKIAYGIKHYNVDTDEDLKVLSTKSKMGTTCFVIETSKYYMLNGKNQWIEINPYGKSSGSSSGGNDDAPPSNDDIIYDGGEVVPPDDDDIVYDGGNV